MELDEAKEILKECSGITKVGYLLDSSTHKI